MWKNIGADMLQVGAIPVIDRTEPVATRESRATTQVARRFTREGQGPFAGLNFVPPHAAV